MRLADWFKERNADGSKRRKGDFAKKIGKSPSTVTAYCDGRAEPSASTAAAIERLTAGAVRAADFEEVAAKVAEPAQ